MTWRFLDEHGLVAIRIVGDVIESSLASVIKEEILPYEPNIPALILRAKAETRIQRQPIITICDGLQGTALTKGDVALALVIETAKQALRDITDLPLYDCTTYAQMKAMTLARYAEIASASPALKAAFSEALK